MERGNFGHAKTVAAVRDALSVVGLTPLYGTPANNFDIGWMTEDRMSVAE
jgi:hypothetical protein